MARGNSVRLTEVQEVITAGLDGQDVNLDTIKRVKRALDKAFKLSGGHASVAKLVTDFDKAFPRQTGTRANLLSDLGISIE